MIIIRLLKGNIAPFTIMFRKYNKLLVAHAYYVLKDMDEAEDAIQDVFTETIESDISGVHIENLRGYLF